MKWFKHDTDMHMDLKIQSLINIHGLEGYAVWVLCLEFVGKHGKNANIKVETRWLDGLLKVCQWSADGSGKVKLEGILWTLADLKLICAKSLKYGNLHIPNFRKRADYYTQKILRTEYTQCTHNVPLDKNRIDKIRIDIERRDKILNPFLEAKGLLRENLSTDDWKRYTKAIATLYGRTDDHTKILAVMAWVNETAKKGNWEWELETVNKRWQAYESQQNKPKVKYE